MRGFILRENHLPFQEAQNLIAKTQAEEKRLHLENSEIEEEVVKPTKVPPPPILLSRTDSTMVFKPAPFTSETGEKAGITSHLTL